MTAKGEANHSTALQSCTAGMTSVRQWGTSHSSIYVGFFSSLDSCGRVFTQVSSITFNIWCLAAVITLEIHLNIIKNTSRWARKECNDKKLNYHVKIYYMTPTRLGFHLTDLDDIIYY